MNEQSDYRPGGRPLTGRLVLLMIIGFFGVMLLVNAVMAIFAVKTFSGLDADNPYDTGLAYNKDIAAARAQGELGWTVELTRTPNGAATEALPNRWPIFARAGQNTLQFALGRRATTHYWIHKIEIQTAH